MSEKILGHCAKCKTKQEVETPQALFTKKGRPVVRGICSVCGTKIFTFAKTALHDAPPESKPSSKPKKRKKAASKKKSDNTSPSSQKPAQKSQLSKAEAGSNATLPAREEPFDSSPPNLELGKIIGYCGKCKTKEEILSPEAVFTQTGRPAVRGVCSVCERKIFSFGKTSLHP